MNIAYSITLLSLGTLTMFFKGLILRVKSIAKQLSECLSPSVFWSVVIFLWCHLKLVACISQASYLSLTVFACLTEQNSKVVDLRLKKLLEAQPQVANLLPSAAQKAVTEASEQGEKVNPADLTDSAAPSTTHTQELLLNSDSAESDIAMRILVCSLSP